VELGSIPNSANGFLRFAFLFANILDMMLILDKTTLKEQELSPRLIQN